MSSIQHLEPSYENLTSDLNCKPIDIDKILDSLTVYGLHSVFFLLMNDNDPLVYLDIIKKDKHILLKFIKDKIYSFPSKESVLIEILGTMKEYQLLKLLNTCKHEYRFAKDTFTELNPFWKCLHIISGLLSEIDIRYIKEKLIPEVDYGNIFYPQQLFCLAYIKKVISEKDLSNLQNIFMERNPKLVKIIMHYQEEPKMKYYPIKRPTKERPCGIVAIFNHTNFEDSRWVPRINSHVDVGKLKDLWEHFGFITEIYEDKSYEEVFQIFLTLAARDHSLYDAFVVCYLSHGDNGVVYTTDCKAIQVNSILNIMANKCHTLLQKPKLFFVQACQGHQGQGVASCPLKDDIIMGCTSLAINTSKYLDCLVAISSFEGFVSYRDGNGRSWFIAELINVFSEFGGILNVTSLMAKLVESVSKKSGSVDESTNHCKQTPVIYTTLKYELILKPMLIERHCCL